MRLRCNALKITIGGMPVTPAPMVSMPQKTSIRRIWENENYFMCDTGGGGFALDKRLGIIPHIGEVVNIKRKERGRDGITEQMAIKAHKDIMERGQALLKDPTIDKELKKLIRQEMENSNLCMEAFGLSGEEKSDTKLREIILHFAPAVNIEKLGDYFAWLDENSRLFGIRELIEVFGYAFADLSGGEAIAIFGVWLADRRYYS